MTITAKIFLALCCLVTATSVQAQPSHDWELTDCPALDIRSMGLMPDSGVMVEDAAGLWCIRPGATQWTRFKYADNFAINRRNVYIATNESGITVCNLDDSLSQLVTIEGCRVPNAYIQSGPYVTDVAISPDSHMFVTILMLYTANTKQQFPTTYICSTVPSNFDSNNAPSRYTVGPHREYYIVDGPQGNVFEHSVDLGVHWEQSSMTFSHVSGIAALLSGDVMLADSTGDVYLSYDRGTSWSSYSDGLIHRSINAIIEDRRGEVYLATDSGLYRSVRKFSPPAIVTAATPTISKLEVWPNPTGGVVNMSFGTNSLLTKITLTDTLGRERSLAPNLSDRAAQVDLSGLPAGVYLLRTEGIGIASTQRIVKE